MDELFRLRPPTEVTLPALVSRQPEEASEAAAEANEGAEEAREGSVSTRRSPMGAESDRNVPLFSHRRPQPKAAESRRRPGAGRRRGEAEPRRFQRLPRPKRRKSSPSVGRDSSASPCCCRPRRGVPPGRPPWRATVRSPTWSYIAFSVNTKQRFLSLLQNGWRRNSRRTDDSCCVNSCRYRGITCKVHRLASPSASGELCSSSASELSSSSSSELFSLSLCRLKFAQELWDTVNSSPLFADYNGLIV